MADPPDDQRIAEAAAAAMWRDDKASQALGMALAAIGPGAATVTMTVRESMVNGHGICHGGYIFLLADSAFAFACNAYNFRCVAQHCAVTFVQAGKLGDQLSARAVEVQRAGRSGIYDITVTRGGGEVIAEFRGHSRQIKGELVPGLTPPQAAE